MNRPPLTAASQDIGTLIDAAQHRAHALRQEAMNEFWGDAACAARRRLRAAQRLAARLTRHRLLRAAAAR